MPTMREKAVAAMAEGRAEHTVKTIEAGKLDYIGTKEFHDEAEGAAFDAALAVLMEPDIDLIMAGSKITDDGDGQLHRRKWQAMLKTLTEKDD